MTPACNYFLIVDFKLADRLKRQNKLIWYKTPSVTECNDHKRVRGGDNLNGVLRTGILSDVHLSDCFVLSERRTALVMQLWTMRNSGTIQFTGRSTSK